MTHLQKPCDTLRRMVESSWRRWWRWPVAFICALPASYVTGLLLLGKATGLSAIVPAMMGTSVVGGLVFYLVARSKVGAILAGVALPAALAAFVGIWLFLAFREHSATYPESPVNSVEPLTTFSEFPVYWLGRAYNGLDLTQIHTQTQGPGPLHTVMYLNYGYGVCTSKGLEERCSSTPILLVVAPACSIPRIYYGNQGSPDRYAWTPDVAIEVWGSAAPSTRILIRDLSLANVSTFPAAPIVDSPTYDLRFRSRCGDAP